jgi:predicted RNase H-like HicB family nuclease
MRYPVVIHKDPESYYGVTIPDLPGCFSAGDTVEDALTQAVEAIECYLEGLLLDSEPIPNPKDITFHTNNPDYADGLWETVSVDLAGLVREVSHKKFSSYSKVSTL